MIEIQQTGLSLCLCARGDLPVYCQRSQERTNIEFVTVEKGVKCFMVTSSMHHEGKSTTIANLSMTMAQLGKRTLLVDCDLRKPSMARLFGLDKEPGVTEVVVGNYKWQDVVRTVTDG